MTITQLEYVVAVAKHGSFFKAAKACFVTQPTLSMQVRKLEDHLGVVLFDRSKKPVLPTPLGARLIEQANVVLREASYLKEIIDEDQVSLRGELKLGIIPTLAPYLLPRMVKPFTEQYPQVTLQVEELQTDLIVDRLKSDTLDAGLLVTPLELEMLVEAPLFYEPFSVYLSKGHKLIRSKTIQQSQLSTEDVFLLSEGHCFRSQVLNLCRSKKSTDVDSHFRFESGSLSTLKKLVDQMSGYTFLPELSLDELLSKEDKKRIRRFHEPQPMREVSLVYRRHFMKKRILEALSGVIKESLPKALLQRPKAKQIISLQEP